MDTMQRLSKAGVIDAVRQWRNQAGHLRDAASPGHLRLPQKAVLLREADAADRQADWWSDCLAQDFGPGDLAPLNGWISSSNEAT